MDRSSEVARYGVDGATETLLAKERRFYDGDDYEGLGYPGSSTTTGVTRGLLSAKLTLAFTDDSFADTFDSAWGAAAARDDSGNFLQDGDEWYLHAERTAYDARGMRIGVLDPNGNEGTIAYETDHGLFVVGFVDAAEHPTELERGDFPFQVLASIDPNDNRTEFTWDARGLPATKSVMGKLVSGAWQGDPATDPTEAYTYDFTTVPVSVRVATRQVRLGATFDVVRYLDGLGRTVQERHTAEPDAATPTTPRFRVTGWQVYNAKGLVVRAYQPTFATSDTYAQGSTATAAVETTYNPLGRPVRVDYPDGTFDTTTYHPWVREAADRNDNAGDSLQLDPRYGDFVSWFSGSV